ncbi:MAG: TfoX/Sxy family protein [Usitatibacteraceae bacterium]
MSKRTEFIDYLLELLQPFGDVTARSMFGGYGIYKDAIIFGLVINDVLYFKVDDTNRREFEVRGLEPFVYETKRAGGRVSVGYYQCPEDALESSAVMTDWARSGFAAALRVAARKQVKHEKKPTPKTRISARANESKKAKP